MAIVERVSVRIKFAISKARWREKRSSIVPTKGPTIEYGTKTSAKARAALIASAWRSGEKRRKEASAL